MTYVVEFDRVHYPLALKLDASSLDALSTEAPTIPRKAANARCATETARKLLSHSIQSNSSSSSSSSSLTSSPTSTATLQGMAKLRSKPTPAHHQSTPHLNGTDAAQQQAQSFRMQEMMAENLRLKARLREREQEYPSDKFADIIESLEDDIKVLKAELDDKNKEIRRMMRSNKQFQKKHISQRLDDLEDEIERLSSDLLSERTKHRKLSRDFQAERLVFSKQIETLEASVGHFKRKSRALADELKATKQSLDSARSKASKHRLYSSTDTLRRSRSRKNTQSSSLLSERKRSTSRKNSKYYLQRNNSKARQKRNRPRARSDRAGCSFQRSSSAPRFQNRRRLQSRSRSPSVRFDPTEWAKKRKQKIQKSKQIQKFGKSRSPSPFRTSRSVSPERGYGRSERKRNRSKSGLKKRDRSNSRKRNSFGTTISARSPVARRNSLGSTGSAGSGKRLPLYSANDENRNDLNLLSSMQKRQQRIMAMNNSTNNESFNDETDDDDESVFNPTNEIESIDSRLNALQKFLRAAKSSK